MKIHEEDYQYLNFTYSVAWIDCIAKKTGNGRSLIYLGEHAKLSDLDKKKIKSPLKIKKKLKIPIPFYLPNWLMSENLIGIFNDIFYFF